MLKQSSPPDDFCKSLAAIIKKNNMLYKNNNKYQGSRAQLK